MEINTETDKNITAEVIADSIEENGNRLTSYVIRFPRIVLAEFNTHRMLSRNSASSRAVPFKKMVKQVTENPFIPLAWQKDHKGMQGTKYFEDPDSMLSLNIAWLEARDAAVENAKNLSIGDGEIGLTKQLCNRLLEPFMYHTAIVTASEWGNFFALRDHPAAEIHIANLANKMLNAYNESTPKSLKPGEWHIPFGDKIEIPRLKDLYKSNGNVETPDEVYYQELDDIRIKIATARCARVSYINYEGKDDYEADIKLHDILSKSGHWSCFEHCAKAMDTEEYHEHISGNNNGLWPEICPEKKNFGWSGNFRGFIQYRKTFKNENRSDDRVKRKKYDI